MQAGGFLRPVTLSLVFDRIHRIPAHLLMTFARTEFAAPKRGVRAAIDSPESNCARRVIAGGETLCRIGKTTSAF